MSNLEQVLFRIDEILDSALAVDSSKRVAAFIRERMSDDLYPCHFASHACTQGRLRIGLIEQNGFSGAAAALNHFIQERRHQDSTITDRSALVLLENASLRANHRAYFDDFWVYLSEIHKRDAHGWPSERCQAPDSSKWMFMFNETAFFVFGMSPTYPTTSSRYLPHGLAIVFVPQQAFSGIERGTMNGARVRDKIAHRLTAYESVARHHDLDQRSIGAQAWRAYFLSQGSSGWPGECPFVVTRIRHRGHTFLVDRRVMAIEPSISQGGALSNGSADVHVHTTIPPLQVGD